MKGVGAIFVIHAPWFTLLTLLQITYASTKVYHKVFVYDDHKRGEAFHNWLTDLDNGVARFIQEGQTVKQYPLVVWEKMAYLLNYPGKGHNVIGEVYDVDDEMLDSFDTIQSHPYFFFRRLESIQLKNSTANEKPIKCWTYFYNGTEPEILELPMLSEYRSGEDSNMIETTTIGQKIR